MMLDMGVENHVEAVQVGFELKVLRSWLVVGLIVLDLIGR